MEVTTHKAFATHLVRHRAILGNDTKPRASQKLRPWVPTGKGHMTAFKQDESPRVPPRTRGSRAQEDLQKRVVHLDDTISRIQEGVRSCAAEFESWSVVVAAQQVALDGLLARCRSSHNVSVTLEM